MHQLEQRFNGRPQARYPYVFLNDGNFTEAFRAGVQQATPAPCLFGRILREHWSYPPFIDQERATAARREMSRQGVAYGGSESYRFMCRYFSGFFWRHPLLDGFDLYWRLEPDVSFKCTLRHDPFVYMQEHNISYGWNILIPEQTATINSLWPTVHAFMQQHPGAVAPNNSLLGLLSRNASGALDYAPGCHMWSNFEIGRLSFFRSAAYREYFEFLDRAGGFFYERWGDAPVHTLAAAALLPQHQVHRFHEIGYQHTGWTHCLPEPEFRELCDCDPTQTVDLHRGKQCVLALQEAVGIH